MVCPYFYAHKSGKESDNYVSRSRKHDVYREGKTVAWSWDTGGGGTGFQRGVDRYGTGLGRGTETGLYAGRCQGAGIFCQRPPAGWKYPRCGHKPVQGSAEPGCGRYE